MEYLTVHILGIPLLIGIQLCKYWTLFQREYSMSQLCSFRQDITVTLHEPGYMVNSQCLTTMVTNSWWSSGHDMGLAGLGMANSELGDYNLFSSG